MAKLFIGGTPKSGTHFCVDFLNNLGIKVGHEYPGPDGLVSWYVFHSPRHYPNYLHINSDDYICLHQLREPLACISSIMTLDKESWAYIRGALQIDLSRPLIERSVETYLRWNEYLENSTFTYKVEEITELFDILDLFGIKYQNKYTAINTRRSGVTPNKSTLSWGEIFTYAHKFYKPLKEFARRHEYNVQ